VYYATFKFFVDVLHVFLFLKCSSLLKPIFCCQSFHANQIILTLFVYKLLNNINFVLATVCDTWTQWTDCSSENKAPCTPGKRERERNCPEEDEKEVEPCMNDCTESE